MQGDPLSPFLFRMVMEGFDSMVIIAIQNRWLRGFKIGDRSKIKEICHLLYADDIVIFCEPKYDQIRYIRMLLSIFETLSGLRVNWGENSLFPIREVPHIQDLATILGCKVDKMPPTYLGMPLGSKHVFTDQKGWKQRAR